MSLETLSSKLLLLGINIPVTSLHRIENNQRTVRDYEIGGFIVALDLDIEELFNPVIKKLDVSQFLILCNIFGIFKLP